MTVPRTINSVTVGQDQLAYRKFLRMLLEEFPEVKEGNTSLVINATVRLTKLRRELEKLGGVTAND